MINIRKELADVTFQKPAFRAMQAIVLAQKY